MRRFGLIGRSLGHSASMAYFTEKFARDEIADCVYERYELPRISDLQQLLAETPELCGFNVTLPYKRAVIPFLDALSEDARAIGAVNCVRRAPDGKLTGYNTDLIGLRVVFDELLGTQAPANGARTDKTPQPLRALVLGTGGASRAVQYALRERGIAFGVVSREATRGDYTYEYLPREVVAQSLLIVNATPVGTAPATDQAPQLPYDVLTPDHRLLDLVYNPAVTHFLAHGLQHGARTRNGELMFRTQADASWRIWTTPDQR